MNGSVHPLRRPDLETHILPDGSCLIFDPASNQGRALNAGGSLVWDYCDGELDASAIAAEVAALFGDAEPARQAALQLLAELEQLGFFATADDRTNDRAGGHDDAGAPS